LAHRANAAQLAVDIRLVRADIPDDFAQFSDAILRIWSL
jgi:hypothetical protein